MAWPRPFSPGRKTNDLFMSTSGRKEVIQSDSPYHGAGAVAQSHERSWQELCARFLPLTSAGSQWRYSRETAPGDPQQGWKLHLSATVLTACEAMRRVAPFLQGRQVLFKAPRSLDELVKINCGLYYGYSQAGKFITVYPRNDQEAVSLARELHKLTEGMPAPLVPFDLELRPGSCVYYRYGSFEHLDMENADGVRIPAMRHPNGGLVPDLRESATAKPDWVSDPFIGERRRRNNETPDSPLKNTYRVFRALAQRGKGGVYQAIDLSVNPPRLCVIKEGRRDGEVGWDGRDGYWRVKNEEQVLGRLRASGVNVPRIYSSFEVEGNYYLVTEFIEGNSLQAVLKKRLRRLTIPRVLHFGNTISLIVSQIHSAGWAWRDCKPSNLILTKRGELRPLDFEGACPVDCPDPLMWSTPEFSPPESEVICRTSSRAPEDVYAIGAIIYLLLTGRLPQSPGPPPASGLRRNAPPLVCAIISELLAPDPKQRPSAQIAALRFGLALSPVEARPESHLGHVLTSVR